MVRQFDPDVVVYLARADTLDTELDGSWQHVGQPAFDRWAELRFRQAIAVLGVRWRHGGPVDLPVLRQRGAG